MQISNNTRDKIQSIPQNIPHFTLIKTDHTNKQEFVKQTKVVGSMVEWLEHQDCGRHSPSSKPTCAILLCPWERHLTALSPAWWPWQAVLNQNLITNKLQADGNILASPEAGQGNCLPYVLVPPSLSWESGK